MQLLYYFILTLAILAFTAFAYMFGWWKGYVTGVLQERHSLQKFKEDTVA